MLLKLISSVFFLFNMATRKFKILYVAHTAFLMDSTDLQGMRKIFDIFLNITSKKKQFPFKVFINKYQIHSRHYCGQLTDLI